MLRFIHDGGIEARVLISLLYLSDKEGGIGGDVVFLGKGKGVGCVQSHNLLPLVRRERLVN